MKIAIVGFGREGQSLLKFLKRDPQHKESEITVLDKSRAVRVPRGVKQKLGPAYLRGLAGYDVVFRSPGIPYTLPAIRKAARKGARISSATALFFERCPAPVIGVTGTKGKGTVSTLLYRILKAAKQDARLAGNIGVPALDLLPKLRKTSRVILELSSFQLQDLAVSPHIAVALEIFPDHQDAHASVREYYDAKANIAQHQTKRDIAFFIPSNKESKRIGMLGRGKKIPIEEKRFTLFSPGALAMKGAHNFRNAVAAATVAAHLGVSSAIIARAARRFTGNEHRLEFVRAVRGVSFYNDSASTTPESLAAAIRAFPGRPCVVIAGGKDKNLNYRAAAAALRSREAKEVKSILLMGENRMKIARAIKNAGGARGGRAKIVMARTLAEAVHKAFRECPRGGAVVLSPGAASFDMFTNYAERGKEFKGLVQKLT